jgi:hypothetical protein
MKTNYFKMAFVGLFAVVALCSCSKDEDDEDSKSAACEILSFSVNGEEWDISGTNITHSYPAGTEKTSLTPVITLSPGASMSPPSNRAQDFFTEQGVTYYVVAEDGGTVKTYIARATTPYFDSGITGDCRWTLVGTDNNYTLTISGNGAMKNYSTGNSVPWRQGGKFIKTLVIQDGVKTIGNEAFYSCFGLTAVNIPNSVTIIGEYAFGLCRGLTSVTISNSVTIIGGRAFISCSGLTTVIIPNSVTTVGDAAFRFCSGLISVTIPNSVTAIGEWAFADCSSLTTVINLNTVPQNILENVFDETDTKACTLKVPASAVDDYKAAPIWREFGNITAN